MSAHTPYVEDTMSNDCVYGEHEHDDSEDCPLVPMVVCEGCAAEAIEDEDGLIRLTPWPCFEATRTGREADVIARLLAEHASASVQPEMEAHRGNDR